MSLSQYLSCWIHVFILVIVVDKKKTLQPNTLEFCLEGHDIDMKYFKNLMLYEFVNILNNIF